MEAVVIVLLGVALIVSLGAHWNNDFEEVQEDAENEK